MQDTKKYRVKYLRKRVDSLTTQSKNLRHMIDDFENYQSYAQNIQCNYVEGSRESGMCLIEGMYYEPIIQNLILQREAINSLIIELNRELVEISKTLPQADSTFGE